jgi:hypothetical protein
MGPAVAMIALMFFVVPANAREPIQADAAFQTPRSAVEAVSIRSATYTGAVHERVARNETNASRASRPSSN